MSRPMRWYPREASSTVCTPMPQPTSSMREPAGMRSTRSMKSHSTATSFGVAVRTVRRYSFPKNCSYQGPSSSASTSGGPASANPAGGGGGFGIGISISAALSGGGAMSLFERTSASSRKSSSGGSLYRAEVGGWLEGRIRGRSLAGRISGGSLKWTSIEGSDRSAESVSGSSPTSGSGSVMNEGSVGSRSSTGSTAASTPLGGSSSTTFETEGAAPLPRDSIESSSMLARGMSAIGTRSARRRRDTWGCKPSGLSADSPLIDAPLWP